MTSLRRDHFVPFRRSAIDQSIPQRFVQHVGHSPHQTAVQTVDGSLTYAELNAAANRVGHALLAALGPGCEPVALLCQDRMSLIIGIIGILKAGKAYLPIDASSPRARILPILARAGTRLLLADRLSVHQAGDLTKPWPGCQFLALDELGSTYSTDDPALPISPDTPAYIFYTSGTTGEPKGVFDSHRNVLHNILRYTNSLGIDATDGLTLLQSASYSGSVSNIFGALLNGATLFPYDLHSAGQAARQMWLQQPGITIYHSVPAVFRSFLHDDVHYPNIRIVRLEGDRADARDVALFRRHFPQTSTLVVGLGATECGIVRQFFVDRQTPTDGPAVPIGYPVEDMTIVLRDEHDRPVNPGQIGEIVVESDYLALGYWDAPELTAAAFRRDPARGTRRYYTGDLGRLAADGCLQYVCRKDFQAKVRGQFIDLAEVQAALLAVDGIAEAIALIREDQPGDHRLVAYLVPATNPAPRLAHIRQRLATSLPDSMIPSAYVLLPSLPLTANGKVDQRALPAPGRSRPPLAAPFVAPRTAIEERLVDIWSDVLAIDQIGVDDSFFDLGGHSLSGIQLLARVHDVFEVDISLRVLFETATISCLAAAIEACLTSGSLTSPPALRSGQRPRDLPLSSAQQRLWLVDQLQAVGGLYAVPLALRLIGSVDQPALERALSALVDRHEVLRTRFDLQGDQPVQVITPAAPVSLPLHDLSELGDTEREEAAGRLIDVALHRPFDLRCDPVFRASMLRLGPTDHILLLVLHHIAADGWSMGVLLEELGAFYSDTVSGRPPSLPPLTVQYADYVLWQRAWLAGAREESQLAYWRRQLAGLPVVELPADYPRPRRLTYAGANHVFTLPPALSAQLAELGRSEQASTFMTLLAAWQTLLARYTGQTDIVVGTDSAGRSHPELERLIGFFVNQLVLRVDLSGNPSFREVLRRARTAALDAYAHQDVPFEQLVMELQPERHLNRSPLFQVKILLQAAPLVPLNLPDLTIRPMDVTAQTAQYDLLLSLVETDGQIAGTLNYSTELFAPATIEHLAACFQAVLGAIVADPDRSLADLPLLSIQDRTRLVTDWNRTAASYPGEPLFHRLFAEQAARRPDDIALIFADQQLTYRALDERTNQLARHLRRLGVGPDVCVGLCIERSLDLIVGMLAILKAGGAYVPLDPSYPEDRLALMLADSQAPVLLTQRALRDRLPSYAGIVVSLDTDGETVGRLGTDALPTAVTPDNLAYVIYTSGSTDRPKGVMISHRSLFLRTLGLVDFYRLDSTDRSFQFLSPSFDASCQEIFPALASGGVLVLHPNPTALLPADLLRECERHGVTTLTVPAPYLPRLVEALEAPEQPALHALRQCTAGGDAFSVDLLARWMGAGREMPRLVNAYGPTETTIAATLADLPADPAAIARLATPPIGHPLPNTTVYLLNHTMEPVPLGAVGEIYIGGAGVARGYRVQPAWTAERFVPDPFGAVPGARLYRTGDLARRLADGSIVYAGRADEQVKIRGYRIETTEIVACLNRYPAVRDSVIVVDGDTPQDKRLVAYLVAHQDRALSTGDLRNFLARQLPGHMIPAAFVVLEALPMLPNGKLDRRALPAVSGARDLATAYVAPRTALEELLAGMWTEVLQIDQIGVHDNFFELGGHSLLGTQLVVRVRDALHVDLSLEMLFAAPTVAGMAEQIEGEQSATTPLPITPIARQDPHGPAVLSFGQERLWFLDQFQPENSSYNTPAAFRFHGPLDLTALQRSLATISARHTALRTRFALHDGSPVQLVDSAVEIPLTLVDLRSLPRAAREAEARAQAHVEAMRPFDLATGPLLRTTIFRLGDEEHLLLLVMHHIVFDAWSTAIFYRELSTCYAAYRAGQVPLLPDLPIQYPDYAHWQRTWLESTVFERQLAYWRRQLADLPVLTLPTDRPRPPVQTFNGALEEMTLPPALSAALTALGRQEGTTLFMTLLAAWQVVLARHTGQEDIPVGMPIAGRTRAETERLIGFFVNMLVLRGDLSDNPTFAQLLARVREATLAAHAHQDLPFERLVEELRPERDLSTTPLVQAVFTVQNALRERPALAGLELTPYALDHRTTKFDLTLIMQEMEDGLRATIEYNTDLFEPATIRRFLLHLETVLRAVVEDPTRPIGDLPVLTPTERQILVDWNSTASTYPREACIHTLFSEQAARTPTAIALVDGDNPLTYQELNERANRLAHYLQTLGVTAEVPVGICVERSADLIVGLLAILKAGGAYVPLDPTYPTERLRFIAADARIAVLLTQRDLAGRLPTASTTVVCLDAIAAQIDRLPAVNPVSPTSALNLAYICYTSGSTGQPKGVSVIHRGVVRLVRETNYASFAPDSVFLQMAPISFDAATFEIWGSLLNGVRLVLCPPQAPTLEELGQILERQQISTLWLTAGLFHQMVDYQLPALRHLRQLLAGGDVLSAPHVERVLIAAPGCMMINGYGPTENTTFTCCYPVPAAGELGSSVPIGRPISNTQVYILTRDLQPAPIGAPGELYIGGDGLARGYNQRPGLTAERFIPSPFSVTPGERLYRTGDLARYRPDGTIEFLGRVDRQVKIRGFRVELGEIEATLAQHPRVQGCTAVVAGDPGGHRQVIAYIVPAASDRPATDAGEHPLSAVIHDPALVEEIRHWLGERVPEYLIPSAFVLLASLPLTANGKIDHAALPPLDLGRSEPAGEYVSGRTPVEQVLTDLWAEVLGVPRVGIHDDFFALGGHSLLATQLLAQIRGTFQVDVPIRDLFAATTIAEFAEVLTARESRPGQVRRIAQFLQHLQETSDHQHREAVGKRT